MSKKRNENLESTNEILERIPKPKRKKSYAPTDINLPALALFRVAKNSSDIEKWESGDKNIKLIFGSGRASINAQRWLLYLFSKIPRVKGGKIDARKLREDGIVFTLAELCDFLEIQNETRNRRSIQQDLEKLAFTILAYHGAYNVRHGNHDVAYTKVKSIPLFEVDLYDEVKNKNLPDSNQLPLWNNRIRLADIIIDNLNDGVFRLISVEDVKRIKSPVAIRIHSIISMHNQSSWKIGLNKLAEQIPLENKHKRKTKQVVLSACEELKQLGILKTVRSYENGKSDTILEFFFPQ